MYLFVFLFFLYAFLGWCTEVSYAALTSGKFVNRGFLNGPICPIYGFGALLVLGLLEPLKGSGPMLFLGSMILTSLLELVTGFVLEKLFHQHWWDYSNEPFNIGGYICLRFSIMWGLACTFVVYLIHPTLLLLVGLLPRPLGVGLLCVLSLATAVDLAATVRTITRFNRQLSTIDELAQHLRELSNEFGENLASTVLDAAEKRVDLKEELNDRTELLREDLKEDLAELRDDFEALQDSISLRADALKDELEKRRAELRRRLEEALDGPVFGRDRLMRAFPRMHSLDHHSALERLRQRIQERGSK